MKNERGSSTAGGLAIIAILVAVIAAWITHVVVCLKAASWGFLIAGAICAPVGIIHGIGVWFGAW